MSEKIHKEAHVFIKQKISILSRNTQCEKRRAANVSGSSEKENFRENVLFQICEQISVI